MWTYEADKKTRDFLGLMSVVLVLSACETPKHYYPEFDIVEPAEYRHLPDYGTYVPVLEIGGQPRALLDYVVYEFQASEPGDSGKQVGEIRLVPKDSLPSTAESAKATFKRNLSVLEKHRNWKVTGGMTRDILIAPVRLIGLAVFWAPGIAIATEYYGHRAISNSANGATESSVSEEVKDSPLVLVKVLDQDGQPLSDAVVIPIAARIPFVVYADQDGRRTYPHFRIHYFELSDNLASLLAECMLETSEYTLDQVLGKPVWRTRDYGIWAHRNPLLQRRLDAIQVDELRGRPGKNALVSYYIVSKHGYYPRVIRLNMLRPEQDSVELVAKLSERERETSKCSGKDTVNPWELAAKWRDMLAQLERSQMRRMYTQSKPGNSSMIEYPEYSAQDIDYLIAQAATVAPDHPWIDIAKYYYHISEGNIETARRHSLFVSDSTYMRDLYRLLPIEGLVRRSESR